MLSRRSVVAASRHRRVLERQAQTHCRHSLQTARSAAASSSSSSWLSCHNNKTPSSSSFAAGSTLRRLEDDTVTLMTTRCYSVTSMALKDYPPHTLFPMPALSPTMESGTITSWNKSEGDAFIAGDVLCAIETDKASVDFEAQDDGILAKILRSGADAVDLPVGTPICVVTEDEDDVAAFSDYVAEDSAAAPAAPAAAEEPATAPSPTPAAAPSPAPAAAASSGPAGTSRLLPSARHLAESKGLDATGLKGSGKGGRVTKGDVLKALADGVSMPALAKADKAEASSSPAPAVAPAAAAAAAAAPAPPKMTLADMIVNPASMAFESTYEDVNNNKMRQIIAKRLTESKATVPHFYTTAEIALDNVMRLRKQWAKELDMKISVNDFILKASAAALREVPQMNASFDTKAGAVKPNHSVDISVAVATPTGLITPIVFGADKIGLSELTATVQDLAKRARDGKLAPHEYQGGTFSVSNLGMFGISEFSAVINPPQAAILAVGGGSPTVLPGPTVKTLMQARLSADRRVVDEATAALFASALREYLEDPESLLL